MNVNSADIQVVRRDLDTDELYRVNADGSEEVISRPGGNVAEAVMADLRRTHRASRGVRHRGSYANQMTEEEFRAIRDGKKSQPTSNEEK